MQMLKPDVRIGAETFSAQHHGRFRALCKVSKCVTESKQKKQEMQKDDVEDPCTTKCRTDYLQRIGLSQHDSKECLSKANICVATTF